MKICQVIDYVPYAKDSQGAERLVEYLIKGLVHLDHDIYLQCSNDTPDSIKNVFGAKIVKHIPDNIDIVHYHGWNYKKFKNSIHPWITTIHGYVFHENASLAEGCKNVIAVSKFAAKNLKVSNYVYNFVNNDEFTFCKDKDNYFLWLAGLDWGESKGLFSTISLAKKLKFNLKIAGSGKNIDIYNSVKNLCDDKIKFVGAKNGEEKKEIFSKAKGYILLSKIPDACPLTISEALSSGTPCIVSSNGSLPDLIKDGITGFVCKNDNDAAKAILNIKKINPEDCKNYARTFFNHIDGAKNYIKIYQDILKQS